MIGCSGSWARQMGKRHLGKADGQSEALGQMSLSQAKSGTWARHLGKGTWARHLGKTALEQGT